MSIIGQIYVSDTEKVLAVVNKVKDSDLELSLIALNRGAPLSRVTHSTKCCDLVNSPFMDLWKKLLFV